MLKLYHLPISFNSRRVWVSLLEKGLEFELITLKLDGDQFTPEFLALNPFHHIPVLVDGEFSVFESLAILDYLEAKYPSPSFLPSDPQALARVRMVELVTINELLSGMSPLLQNMMGIIEITPEKKEKALEKIGSVLSLFDQWLGDRPYFMGDNLTLADIVAGTTVPLLPMIEGVPLSDYPRLTAWTERLMARESWLSTHPTPEANDAHKETIKKLMSQRG